MKETNNDIYYGVKGVYDLFQENEQKGDAAIIKYEFNEREDVLFNLWVYDQ